MNSDKEFENYVKSIYTMLLNQKDEGILVTGGATTFLRGLSGENYQIDVYYEFVRAGIKHKVIIECKNWKSPVKREIVTYLSTDKNRNYPTRDRCS